MTGRPLVDDKTRLLPMGSLLLLQLGRVPRSCFPIRRPFVETGAIMTDTFRK